MEQRILYLSTITPGLELPEVRQIVARAQVRNRQRDLTGVLAMGRRYFAQVLEGDTQQVQPLLGRIALDPRHRDVKVVLTETTGRRLFQRWDMELLYEEVLDDTLAHVHAGDLPPEQLVAQLLGKAQEDRR